MKKFAFEILAVTLCFASTPLLRAADYHAFLWSAETGMQDLGTLGGSSSFATAVNDDGAVVGFSDTSEGTTHAFLWTAEEGMQDLGVPDGRYDTSFARAINNKNEISGSVSNTSGAEAAFYWTATTGFILLTPGTVDG
jgi:probable HAF family extracellular repeat protein